MKTSLMPKQPIEVPVPVTLRQIKPIFVTPPTHTAQAGESRTFTITLETTVPENAGDDYDVTVTMNPSLLSSWPSTIHVNPGESSFNLMVTAATGAGTGQVNLELRERVHGGTITATLIVQP